MWLMLVVSVVIVAYNNVVNRWPPFHSSAYVPVNLLFAGAVTATAVAAFDLTATDLGLQGDIGDVFLPLVLVAFFGLGAFALASSRHAHRIADRRVLGLHGRGLLFYVLVRIPLGTALAEELIFRGVLFASWRAAGSSGITAALYASVAFGLWHIAPTMIGLRINDPDASTAKVRAAVIAAVVLTTVAGLGLTWLRAQSGSLLGSILLHAGVNSVGALAAVFAHRQTDGGTGARR